MTGAIRRATGCLGEVAGERSPGDGDVDLACRDRLDDARRRVGNRVVAIDGIAAQLAYDAAMAKRMDRRRVGAVVADELDADPQIAQPRVVEGGDVGTVRRG